MKKILTFLAVGLSSVATAQQTTTFDEVEFDNLLSGNSFWDGSDMSGSEIQSGVFVTEIDNQNLIFENYYDTTFGAVYGFWSDGWLVSSEITISASNGEIHAANAGSGFGGSGNYLVGQNGSKIFTNNPTTFRSIRVSNNNYAANSMQNGDAFAKQFGGATGDDPDWFLLSIVAHNTLEAFDTIEVYLADYRFTDNSLDYILDDWLEVDLTSFGEVVSLEFVLTSSDVGQWGMNTPAFFSLDQVISDELFASVSENENFSVNVFPNPAVNQLNIQGDFENETILNIYNLQGQKIMTDIIGQGNQIKNIDVSDLSSGYYTIQLANERNSITQKFIKK